MMVFTTCVLIIPLWPNFIQYFHVRHNFINIYFKQKLFKEVLKEIASHGHSLSFWGYGFGLTCKTRRSRGFQPNETTSQLLAGQFRRPNLFPFSLSPYSQRCGGKPNSTKMLNNIKLEQPLSNSAMWTE